ncbi:MAG: hypothetical protein P4L38_13765 [Syntrophaceae bacterium]|nr:hypothetical protein [Syntrophaceae bacterium]
MKKIFQIHGPLEIPKSANPVYLKDREGLFETLGFSYRNLSSDDESLTIQVSPALNNILARTTMCRREQKPVVAYELLPHHMQ